MSEYKFVMMHLPCLSFMQHIFLQASEMMKSLTLFDFHLSLGKNIGAAFRRSAANASLQIYIHRLPRRNNGGGYIHIQLLYIEALRSLASNMWDRNVEVDEVHKLLKVLKRA